ncbi:MAG: UvrD-helicase domain-containing protein [Bdellovibrionota bacterium]
MELEHELNPEQLDAVQTTQGPLLVLAGAGSGKTRVITYRIAHLIRDQGIDPWGIYAVTFTNKAAAQMKARVESLLGGTGLGGLWISTFHSSCVRILRRDIERLGFKSHFVIYDDKEQLQVLKEVLKDLDISDRVVDARSVAWKIDQLKNAGHTPRDSDSWNVGFTLGEDKLQRIYATYQERLLKMNALDFGDLLLLTVRLFEEHPDVLESYRQQFQYVLVDEYQDTNRVQYRLVKLLSEPRCNICVVGDDDQSIYKWRGADLGNILDFEKDFPGTKVIKLERNYRSTGKILEVANGVISWNKERKGKVLRATREAGSYPTYHLALDEHEEARFTADQALRIRGEEERNWRDFAIFYRTNAQSRVLEEELLRRRVPYVLVGGQKFYERAEIKDALGYLRLLINPADDIGFLRIVNSPPRGIGGSTIEKLEAIARERNLTLLAASQIAAKENLLGTGPKGKLQAFLDLYDKLSKIAKEFGPSDLLRSVLTDTGYIRSLEEDGSVESLSRIENLDELVNAVSEYEEASENPQIAEFLERVALVADIDGYAEAEDRLVLMTLHTAKGLEFPVVFLTGLEEGLFPHERSTLEDAALEEERRLCYVGITRAMERLYLTGAQQRRVFGQTFVNEPSRFLHEIPPHLLKLSGLAEPRAQREERRIVRHRPERREIETPVFTQALGKGPISSSFKFTFPTGTRVDHPTFGAGVVKEASFVGGQEKVTVAFARHGVKKLMVKFANLRRA